MRYAPSTPWERRIVRHAFQTTQRNRTVSQRLIRLIWEELQRKPRQIAFAESCTAGAVAAALGKLPGISEYLCGSMVTYQESTKQEWLGVRATTLKKHTAVSSPVAIEMARGLLRRTPPADWGLAITGHLGPNAPEALDGRVYVAAARRRGKSRVELVAAECYHLSERTRLRRRTEAVAIVLDLLLELLANE